MTVLRWSTKMPEGGLLTQGRNSKWLAHTDIAHLYNAAHDKPETGMYAVRTTFHFDAFHRISIPRLVRP